MGVPFDSFSKWLPNNRAWVTHVPYNNKELEMENVTNCTAIGNGWVWNIPLYNRIGSGYVFSNKFISEELALEEYKQYVEAQRLSSLAIALDALRKSNAMLENNFNLSDEENK